MIKSYEMPVISAYSVKNKLLCKSIFGFVMLFLLADLLKAQDSLEIICPANITVRANPGANDAFIQVPLPQIKIPSKKIMYVHDTNAQLFTLDLQTFQKNIMGVTNVFSNEAEINSRTGLAILIASDGAVFKLDLETAQTTLLSQVDERIQALEWIHDTLYYANTAGGFGIMDPFTGNLTQLVDFPSGIGGLAYDPMNDILYASACCNRASFFIIDRKNLSLIPSGGLSFPMSTIEFGPDGFVYGGTNRISASPGIHRINPQNRQSTRVSEGSTGVGVTGLMLFEQKPAISFRNDFTGQEDASANYPLGRTTVTYTLVSDQGDSAECSFIVEVLPALEVVSFTLLDGTTHQPIPGFNPIPAEAKIDLSTLPEKINIRANTLPNQVGSVIFLLTGTQNTSRIENIAPYELFGDPGGQLTAGKYTLKATPYSQSQAQGTIGTALSLNFEIFKKPDVAQLLFFNATQDQLIQPLTPQAIINLSQSSGTEFTVQALTEPTKVGSVVFNLSGVITQAKTENLAPYTLFGDDGFSNFQGVTLPVGQYRLQATAYSQPNKGGLSGPSKDIDFLLVRDNTLFVSSLTLINAQNDQDIRNMNFRDIIDLQQVGQQISFRANAQGNNLVKSVRFELLNAKGTLIHQQIENIMPWALFGDTPQGNYAPWIPENGEYRLLLTPFSETGARGLAGIKTTYLFQVKGKIQTIAEPDSYPILEVYPNPWNQEDLKIQLNNTSLTNVTIEIRHSSGRLVREVNYKGIAEKSLLVLPLGGEIEPGLYHLIFKAEGIIKTVQLLKN
ncbi:MAG: T9SS type A sorting domain-containing protein [Microscillaceae bacterium]|nr:T9SS type A sorting domain-containing protein [Microscillaceae bacterium]